VFGRDLGDGVGEEDGLFLWLMFDGDVDEVGSFAGDSGGDFFEVANSLIEVWEEVGFLDDEF
jgi:hypothetical protein